MLCFRIKTEQNISNKETHFSLSERLTSDWGNKITFGTSICLAHWAVFFFVNYPGRTIILNSESNGRMLTDFLDLQ